jgi:hypothetical protein
LAAENPGGGFEIGGSPAGAVSEMVPAYEPAVAPPRAVARLLEYEQPPTAGDMIVPTPTRLPPVNVPDVAPDVLQEAVVYVEAGIVAVAVADGAALGVADEPFPLQAANATPKTAKSAQNAPERDLFFRIGRASRYFRWAPRTAD